MGWAMKIVNLLVLGRPYLRLAWVMYSHLKAVENRQELITAITDAINDDERLTVGEWAKIGSALGVFRDDG